MTHVYLLLYSKEEEEVKRWRETEWCSPTEVSEGEILIIPKRLV
jgi:hypothetical protein